MQPELVTAAQRGDAEAFAALARLSADRLYAVAVRVTRDRHRAEDALQQALIAAWKELPRLRDPERFEAWTYRLVVRFAVQVGTKVAASRVTTWSHDGARAQPGDASADVATRDQLERRISASDSGAACRPRPPLLQPPACPWPRSPMSSASHSGRSARGCTTPKRALRAALEADDRVEERTA